MSEDTDLGRLPAAPGYSAEPEPVPVSAVPASIPSAMLPRATYVSCGICNGTREAFGGACSSCADPEPAVARFVLERLHPDQISFLRAYGHTLAYQPLSKIEHDEWRCEYWVEADDGEWCEDALTWIIPPTRYWFAGGMMHFGPCGEGYFIKYNPLGLLLRSCLMPGADAAVPHYTPAAHPQSETPHGPA